MLWGLLVGALLLGAAPSRIVVQDVRVTGAGEARSVEGLSALLASEVARRQGLIVVAGADLRSQLGPDGKWLPGCTEAACLGWLAGRLGAVYLVSSECSRVGSTWLLSLSLFDAGRATTVSRLTRRAASEDGLVDAVPLAVDELLAALPGLPPAPPAPPSQERVVASAPGRPMPAVEPPGSHRHDGLFLRLQLGGGALESKSSLRTFSGGGACLSMALGYSLGDHLVLFGEVFDDLDTSPKLSGVGSATTTAKAHGLVGYGLGAAWYFMPINAYLSVTGGIGLMSITLNEKAGKTKIGPIGRLSLGKEWWLSAEWGLGLSLNFEKGSMENQQVAGQVTETFDSTAYSVALSATFN
jgi:hypothetical protein